jgi:hypothetical protein
METRKKLLTNSHCGGVEDNVSKDAGVPEGYQSYCGEE